MRGDDAVEGSCTVDSKTATVYCSNCNGIVAEPVVTPAPGHNYVDGICDACGEEKPAGYTKVTNVSDLKAGDQVIIVATGSDYALSTAQGSNNRGRAKVEKDGDVVIFGEDTQVLTLEEGTTTGTFAFNTGNGYLYAASSGSNYLRTETTKSANSSWAITIDANGVATVKAQGTNTRNWLRYNSSNGIFSCYGSGQLDIAIYKLYTSGGSEPEQPNCEHPNAENINVVAPGCETVGTHDVYCPDCDKVIEQGVETPANGHNYVDGKCSVCNSCQHLTKIDAGEAKEPTCTEPGLTAGVKCAVCGNVLEDQAEIPATGHTYEDGECTECGAEQPDEVEGTIIFDENKTQRTEYSESVQVWTDGVVTFTNNKAGSTSNVGNFSNPGRVYKNSEVVISCDPAYVITSITIVAAGTDQYKTPWEDTLKNADVTPKVDGDNYTVEFATGVESFTCTATAQIRLASLKVTCVAVGAVEPPCDHQGYSTYEGDDAVEGSCTVDSQTATVYCSNCNGIVAAPVVTPAPGHNYVDGSCGVCGAAEPERYYIAAYRDSEDKYYFLTSDLEDNKRYQAVAANILPSNIDPDAVESNYVFLLTDNGNGTFYLQAENVTDNNYLTHTGTSNTGTYASLENAPKLTVDITDKGYYNIHFTSDEERYLSLNGTRENNFFAWYKGTQKQDLVLIPVEEAEDLTATLYGNVDGLTATGDLTLDLNGYAATNVQADKIYACDSSAKYTKDANGNITSVEAGSGSLTVAAGVSVVTDNTVNGLRYIALNDAGTYTFHILNLRLSAISLRASAQGIYYKAEMVCDEVLQQATAYHGMVVSLRDMPGVDFAQPTEEADNNCYTMIEGAPSGKNFTSCAVFGIFKYGKDNASRGNMKIYANAFLQLAGTNEIIMADTTAGDKATDAGFDGIAWSLRDVMERLDSNLSDSNRDTVVNFYKAWADAMDVEGDEWAISNIRAAANPTPAE